MALRTMDWSVSPSPDSVCVVRLLEPRDVEPVIRLRTALWPDCLPEEQGAEVTAILNNAPRSTLPLVIFVAEVQRELAGFAEVGLRSHADGCDPIRPVGFLEGWYVAPEYRRRGIGRMLLEAAENWCRQQHCVEMASDTWLDNPASQRAHAALGFEVVDRCVNFRKDLRR